MSVGKSASKLLQLESVIWCELYTSQCVREQTSPNTLLVYSAESEGEKKEEKKKMCNTVRNVHCMGQKLYVYSPVGER